MKRILDGNVKFWHVLVVGVMTLVLTGGTVVWAAGGGSFFASGKVRMASAWSDAPIDIAGTDNPPVKVLSAPFKVPAGKRADVQATFSASVHHLIGTHAYCFGRFTIDTPPPNNVFRPGQAHQLLGGPTASQPNAFSAAMTGFRKNVGPGSHQVHVYVHSAFAGCQLQERNLNVLVNIR